MRIEVPRPCESGLPACHSSAASLHVRDDWPVRCEDDVESSERGIIRSAIPTKDTRREARRRGRRSGR